MTVKRTVGICIGVLLVAGVLMAVIFSTEPTAQRSGATKQTAMLVQVTPASPDTVRPTIRAMGTVRPVEDVVLRPRVGGQIVARSDAFEPGGTVRAGEVLMRIDPADYRNALRQRESELRQAESDLTLEMGRQNVAQQDYQLLEDTLSASNRALVLREPQLSAARSQVESARAAVEQARLQLERTRIRAPFDAQVLQRDVSVGSQVDPGDVLGRLVGRDVYWVEATIPLAKLRWVSTDAADAPPVRIRNRTAWGPDAFREGRLVKVVGALEDQTRMARVLIEVDDPAAARPAHDGQPALVIGSYVEATIPTRRLDHVFRVNRDYVRDDDTIWLLENDSLRIRDVDVVFRDATYAYVDRGLADGDSIVTTNLSTVSDGAPLRLDGSTDGPADNASLPDPAQGGG